MIRGKALIFVLAAALALALTGCGEDGKSSAPASPGDKTDSASSSGGVTGDTPTSSDSSQGEAITAGPYVKIEIVNSGEANVIVNTDFLKKWGDGKVVYLAFWSGEPGLDTAEIMICRLESDQALVSIPEGGYMSGDTIDSESFPDGMVTWNVSYEGIEQLLRSSRFVELHTEDYTGENVVTEQLMETNDTGEIASLFVSGEGLSASADTSSGSDSDTGVGTPVSGYTSADDFEWTVTSGGVMITGYKGSGGDVFIPDSIESSAVTQIGDSAFSNKGEITSITIPDSVISIGRCAFEECNFTSVSFGGGVRTIEEMAFARCYSLTSIVLPNSAVEFGQDVFAQCEQLSSVTLPDTMTEIPVGMFGNCIGLKSIEFPNSVRSIAKNAFYGTGIESLNIAGNVSAIGEGAFGGCNALKTVTVSNSVSSIGERAFAECYALEQVSIPAVVSTDKLLTIFSQSEKVKVSCGGSTYDYEKIAEMYKP